MAALDLQGHQAGHGLPQLVRPVLELPWDPWPLLRSSRYVPTPLLPQSRCSAELSHQGHVLAVGRQR